MKFLSLSAAIAAALSTSAFAADYTIELVDVDGKPAVVADMNDAGVIAGTVYTFVEAGEEYCGDIYKRGAFKKMNDQVSVYREDQYGVCGGSQILSNALSIALKDNGDVVGSFNGRAYGVFGTVDVDFHDQLVNAFGSSSYGSSALYGIADNYDLIGSYNGDAVMRKNDQWIKLADGNGNEVSYAATDINGNGQVLVSHRGRYGFSEVLFWENYNLQSLPEFLPGNGNFQTTYAADLNDAGHFVGSTAEAQGGAYFHNGVINNTGTFPGAASVSISALNNDDVLVGSALMDSNNYASSKAIVYVNGEWQDLNTMIPANSGWNLIQAISINNNGEIAGNGFYNGEQRIFKLTPADTNNGTMYLRGSFNGWGTLAMNYADGEFEVTVDLDQGDQFKFDTNGDWSLSYGDNNQDGIADSDGGGNIVVSSQSGSYIVSFNPTTLAYSVELDEEPQGNGASVDFGCERGNTSWGQNVYVVGAAEALGNWNPDNAVKLDPDMYPLWTGVITGLPTNASIQWKCIKKQGSQVVWQSGGNNIALTGGEGSVVNATGSF